VEALTKPELTGDWEYKLKQMERGRLPRDTFMQEIRALVEDIVRRAKACEHDTIPGDFGVLQARCPKCGGEVHENYKKFQCQNPACDFGLWKIISGRQFEPEEVEQLITRKQVGPLQGFRSKLGKPFAAVIKLSPEYRLEFDFGNDTRDADGNSPAAKVDFTGKEPVGLCPKCHHGVFENGMNYVCEQAVGASRTCDFRAGAVILQRAIERPQFAKLLAEGKTDLLGGFVSKKTGRTFEAFLVLKDGAVRFEFAPRPPRAKRNVGAKKAAETSAPLNFTGQEPLGTCPLCGGKVFESDRHYLCERTQAPAKPCKFTTGRVILRRPIERAEISKLLADRRTELLSHFTSKAGRPFSAYLVLGEGGKVGFEFPPREVEAG
jgi:DNA topoisomerase III